MGGGPCLLPDTFFPPPGSWPSALTRDEGRNGFDDEALHQESTIIDPG
jgi:hypothetical protein